MKNPLLAQAVKTSADPERVGRFLELLAATGAASALAAMSAEPARILAALFSGSQVLGNLLVAHPDWLSFLEVERLRFPRREQGLRSEVAAWLKPLLEKGDYPRALGRLREFKQREMLRIAARDLARLGNVAEITREISDVADVCLERGLADLPAGNGSSGSASPGTRTRRTAGSRRSSACWAWASWAARN